MSVVQNPEVYGLYFTDSYNPTVVLRGENAKAAGSEQIPVAYSDELDDVPKYADGSPGQKGVTGLPVKCEVSKDGFTQAEDVERLSDGSIEDKELRRIISDLRQILGDLQDTVRRLNRYLDDR